MNAYRSLSSRYHWTSRRRKLLAAFVLLAALLLSFLAGRHIAGGDPESAHHLRVENKALQKELNTVRGDLKVQHNGHEVDRRALEMLRRDLAAQKEQIADLEESLGFFRGLMAPDTLENGTISIRSPELVVGQRPGQISYRIVVLQEARKHELVKGRLSAEISGLFKGQEVTYQLSELSSDLEGPEVVLDFRYFQSIEGELTIPEGFEPGVVTLHAQVSNPHDLNVQEQFPWQIQERFTHVGK